MNGLGGVDLDSIISVDLLRVTGSQMPRVELTETDVSFFGLLCGGNAGAGVHDVGRASVGAAGCHEILTLNSRMVAAKVRFNFPIKYQSTHKLAKQGTNDPVKHGSPNF